MWSHLVNLESADKFGDSSGNNLQFRHLANALNPERLTVSKDNTGIIHEMNRNCQSGFWNLLVNQEACWEIQSLLAKYEVCGKFWNLLVTIYNSGIWQALSIQSDVQ